MFFTTENLLPAIFVGVVGYLLGSLSFAIIVSRLFKGDDIRNHGSGNAGLTNTLRVYGKGAALMVLIGDFTKGILAVVLARYVFGLMDITFMDGGYIGGMCALLGHLFPIYFGFKGGKGVLTGAGILLGLNWWVLLIVLTPFIILTAITRLVSLGSVAAAVCYPVATYAVKTIGGKPALFETIFALILAIIIIFMHRKNIMRIIAGTESKLGQKK